MTFCACQILENSFNSSQIRGTGTEIFRSQSMEYVRVNLPYWPCIISTVAKERNPCTTESLLPQFYQQNCSLCQNIQNTRCISTLTRFLGDGTLYVSGQCMEGGRGYRGRQGSKSLPLPLASRPHFKIITSRAQLNIIHVFRTSLLLSIKKGVCYEWTEIFGAVQFSSGQTSG
jgi:hypothetical protein